MRTSKVLMLLAAAAFFGSANVAVAQDHGSVSFVTGMSMSNGSPLVNAVSSLSPGINDRINLGGRVAINLTPGFQAIGEVGRLGNVLPPLEAAVFSFSPVGLRASAFYGEGGVRAFLGTRSNVNPYVEATGGISRLTVRVAGTNATTSDLIQLGLGFVDRTSPMAGLGGGVMFHAGALTVDAGYRYKKIFAGNFMSALLTGGSELTSHQAVVGVGLRF